MTITAVPHYKNIFELARAYPLPHSAVFNRLFDVKIGSPRCTGTRQLAEKYRVAEDNVQTVVSVTNRVLFSQCWYNEARTQKPQTFVAAAAAGGAALPDPTVGKGCDFCDWQTLTATDTFGRIEGQHAVSASNLFKYCSPAQGVILFKHHDPLQFSLAQLADLLNVSHGWFEAAAAAAAAEEDAQRRQQAEQQAEQQQCDGSHSSTTHQPHHRPHLHPLFIWNALPRAGASQFHGHAQVLLSSSPFPQIQQQREAIACYNMTHSGASYYQDVLEAHQAVGLLRSAGSSSDRAFCYPSLSPAKDMELVIQGTHMRSPAFQLLFHAALRSLIDELGVQTFNASIHNIQLPGLNGPAGGDAAQQGGASGHSAGAGAFHAHAEPVVARVVSRGKLSSQASDFGGLEVFGGASIGHTDPWRVAEALDAVLARAATLDAVQ